MRSLAAEKLDAISGVFRQLVSANGERFFGKKRIGDLAEVDFVRSGCALFRRRGGIRYRWIEGR